MREYAAIDLGATSGRVFAGGLRDGRVARGALGRVETRPVRLPDGLRWNLLHLFTEALAGLRMAGPLAGVGVDTWGVDYALLDGRGRVLGLPFHYRDRRTNGMIERAFERVAADELYATTGIQTLPINTVFQLLADEGSAARGGAERVARVPDRRALWVSGELANERTAASTTGLLDARSGDWAHEAIDRLGLPGRLFGPLVDPGTALGRALGHHEIGEPTVYAVASHDTASAFAAAPIADGHAAVLSSGTWSLLGLEMPEPVLADSELTNERGVDGTTRLLRNVMGMWLLEECRRAWGDVSYEELHRLAEAETGEAALFEPFPELSPDGTQVAIGERVSGTWGLSVIDLARGTRVRLAGGERVSTPAWAPDGRSILYSARPPGAADQVIRRVWPDGSPSESLEPGFRPASPDGLRYFFDRLRNNDFDLLVGTLDRTAPTETFVGGALADVAARPSPDGRLVAYMSMPSIVVGNPEVVLRRYPLTDTRWQVSSGGGSHPRWSSKGDRVYYITADGIYEVAVTTSGQSLTLSPPRRLFARRAPLTEIGPDGFDVARDGRFLLLEQVASSTERFVHVVLNWTARRVPGT